MNSLRDPGRCPTHPGEILREDVLPALAVTQGEFARRLGVSRRTVSELLHERRPITPDMAIRLGRLLGNPPEFWMRMQAACDVWELQRTRESEYGRISPLEQAEIH